MVSRDKNLPLYMQVYEALLDAICKGEYRNGGMLPTEKGLAAQFNVDRQTVRKALDLLVNEGVLEKRPGVGSFVKDLLAQTNPNAGPATAAFTLPAVDNRLNRIAEPFNTKLFLEIERHCREKSLQLTYTSLGTVSDLARLPENVVGVFVVSRVPKAVVDEMRARAMPAVVVNSHDPHSVSVQADNFNGAKAATQHLIQLQHTTIGYIGGVQGYDTSIERYAGYVQALFEAQLAWDEMPVAHGDWTFDGGFRAMRAILERAPQLPTAVFAANDMMAIGAIHAARDFGLAIPGQMSIVGFDNIEQGLYMQPSLTTVGVDLDLMARLAVTNLHQIIAYNEHLAYKIVIPTQLILRESTSVAHERLTSSGVGGGNPEIPRQGTKEP